MSEIPVPRSFPQIVGDMENAFLSSAAAQGVQSLRAGSPLLSIFECAAQSDMRSSQDIFDLLNSVSLDKATGLALVRIGEEEGLARLTEAPSTGTVDISDNSWTRVATKLYQALPPPIVGSTRIFVADTTLWPATGAVYIGRGTSHYEGPLSYSSIIDNTIYSELVLLNPQSTTKVHDMGESVILSSPGGNRTIGSGCVVKTPRVSVAEAIEFRTLHTVTIPDGETGVQGVKVVATKPGRLGDVPAGAISQFSSTPFDGAIVTNPLPFGNSRETETDEEYRDRIRASRKTRTKGTSLALTTAVSGITAPDENRRVSSASIVTRAGYPATLYIDDGTGYEERSTGVAVEVLMDSAVGGEQYFQTECRPIAKAFLLARNAHPYSLPHGARIEVRVGGITYIHDFDPVDFASFSSATAHEVVASINANEQLAFHARISDSRVVLFAKADVNEDLEIVGGTVSDVFRFPAGTNYSLQLYKSDRLLVKDGRKAVLFSNLFGDWNAFSTPPHTLLITVDGTTPLTVTFTDQDFIDAETGFNLVDRNNLAAWIKVINRKIPGITASEDQGRIALISNAGEKGTASVEITGGALVIARMFSVDKVQGQNKDYVLDRNTGQLRLETVLVAGERLSIGSANTRGFIESTEIEVTSPSGDSYLWFSVDGDATRIAHGLSGADAITITVEDDAYAWGYFRKIAAEVPAFINVREGDWMICYDPEAHSSILGHFRVAQVERDLDGDVLGSWIMIERNDATPMVDTTMMNLSTPPRLVFVRTLEPLQLLVLPAANNYTASSLVAFLNTKLVGATASVFKTNRLRVTTNSQGLEGDIALVAADDLAAATFKLPIGNATDNLVGHIASVETGNPETGTPTFADFELTTEMSIPTPGIDQWGIATATLPSTLPLDFGGGHQLVGVRNAWDELADRRFGSTLNRRMRSFGIAPNQVFLRVPGHDGDLMWGNRFYAAAPYAIGPKDDLVVQVDDDPDKRFAIPMWRKLKTTTLYYGGDAVGFADGDVPEDVDNNSLAATFGLSYPFEDFTVYMPARAVAFTEPDERVLIRWHEAGPDGNYARVRFSNPLAPDAVTTVVVDNHDEKTNVRIHLPSGEARTMSIRASTRLGVAVTAETAGVGTLVFALGFSTTGASRIDGTDQTTISLQLPPLVEDCGLVAGDRIYLDSIHADFVDGTYTVISVGGLTGGPGGIQDVIVTDLTLLDSSVAANIGTVSLDTQGAALFGGEVVVGDYLRVKSIVGFGWPVENTTFRVSVKEDQYLVCTSGENLITTLAPDLDIEPLQLASNLQVFASAPTTTITAIADAVNAAAASPIKMQVLGTGAGFVNSSTTEEEEDNEFWYNLTDGVNWIAQVFPPDDVNDDYSFSFKATTPASLEGTVGLVNWDEEEVYICPTTAANVAKWLGTPGVTGLSASCQAQVSSNGAKVQLASTTPGAVGAIHVQGGKANAVNAAVIGEGVAVGADAGLIKGLSTVSKSLAAGLTSGMWVSIDNTNTLVKSNIFTDATKLLSWSASGLMTFEAPQKLYTENLAPGPLKAAFNKQGNFVAISFAGVEAGEVLRITAPSAPTAGWSDLQVPIQNQGIFRIVRSQTGTVWVENSGGVDGTFEGVFAIYSDRRDTHNVTVNPSILPGDELVINTSLWGAENKGTWVVERVGVADDTTTEQFTTLTTLKVRVTDRTPRAIPTPVALGTQVAGVHVVEGKPSRLIKQIEGISPNPENSSFVDIRWDNAESVESISAQAGSVIHALDKLDFSTDLAVGNDGYEYNTGLIGEANRIVYGDPSDTSAYPGVAAAGAVVNINGPIVKRLKVALQLRVRTGASGVDITNRVRSAVASFINKTGVGQPVAISALIAAASRVGGVISVTVMSPTFNSEHDLVSIQPFEKPLIVQPSRDIQITFAGE